MIGLRGVTQRFGETVALDRVDLELEPGRVTALTGPNGAGKTTAGHLLLGLLQPTAGTVEGVAGLRRAAVFQEDRLCGQLTAVDNLRLVVPRRVSPAAVARELALVGLEEPALSKPVRELSGGQRRRVAIARAMLPAAGLLVLDEPFAGLDADGRERVMAHVRARCRGATVLLVTHDPADADVFDARLVALAPQGALALAGAAPDAGQRARAAATPGLPPMG